MYHTALRRAAHLRAAPAPRSSAIDYLRSLGLLLSASCGAWLIHTFWGIPGVAPLFILSALHCAIRFSFGPTLLNALGGIGAYLFLAIPPVGTFHLQREEDLLRLLIFVVGILGSTSLVTQVRQRLMTTRRERAALTQLYTLSQAIAAALTPADVGLPVLAALTTFLHPIPCRLFVITERGGAFPIASSGAWPAAGRPTRVILSQDGRTLGRIELAAPQPLTPPQRQLLDLIARQTTLALERCQLVQQTIEADRLAQGDRLKATLLAAVAHEVKTPLTSLRAASEELSDPSMAWSPEDVATFAAVIAQEARRMFDLLGALLDHSRIAAGALRPDATTVDLPALIAEAVQHESGALAGHPVQIELPEALPALCGDRVLLARALGNLLRNAGRHTPPGTPVSVRASAAAGVVELAVIDAGPGLPQALGHRSGSPLPPRAGHDRQGAPGLGLGLAICAGIAEAHGGTLSLGSAPGGGLIARMRLPLRAVGDLREDV